MKRLREDQSSLADPAPDFVTNPGLSPAVHYRDLIQDPGLGSAVLKRSDLGSRFGSYCTKEI